MRCSLTDIISSEQLRKLKKIKPFGHSEASKKKIQTDFAHSPRPGENDPYMSQLHILLYSRIQIQQIFDWMASGLSHQSLLLSSIFCHHGTTCFVSNLLCVQILGFQLDHKFLWPTNCNYYLKMQFVVPHGPRYFFAHVISLSQLHQH